ncbi:MAG TPA: DUF488 domain-containing protein [Ohtaekwangia sp.]|uniref:DUF488 domain-containing protein n=1 Tax=Ohtaekwangia sp. TaxID=2066019 RepID=UPI002F95C10C
MKHIPDTIYTIGHSTHSLEYFLELLQAHHITCLVDVRSLAASRYNPQYNKDTFSAFLKGNGIQYLHFGYEFGARQTAAELLDHEGQLDFEKVRNASHFKKGVDRLQQGIAKGYTIALMCAESEPLDCHRFGMVAVALARNGFDVLHILKDKTLKSNATLEQDLLKKYAKKLPTADIFTPAISHDTQLAAAYRLLNKDIAYAPGELDE